MTIMSFGKHSSKISVNVPRPWLLSRLRGGDEALRKVKEIPPYLIYMDGPLSGGDPVHGCGKNGHREDLTVGATATRHILS